MHCWGSTMSLSTVLDMGRLIGLDQLLIHRCVFVCFSIKSNALLGSTMSFSMVSVIGAGPLSNILLDRLTIGAEPFTNIPMYFFREHNIGVTNVILNGMISGWTGLLWLKHSPTYRGKIIWWMSYWGQQCHSCVWSIVLLQLFITLQYTCINKVYQ